MTQVQRGLYRHFKGNMYRVLGMAQHSEKDESLVIYQSLENSKVWARPVSMFTGLTPDGLIRFEYLGSEVADIDLGDLTNNRAGDEYLEALYFHFVQRLIEDFDGQTLFNRLILRTSRMRQILKDLIVKEAEVNEASSQNVRNLRLLVDKCVSLENQARHLQELASSDETAYVSIRFAAVPEARFTLEIGGSWVKGRTQFYKGRTLEEALYRAVTAFRKGIIR